MKTFNPTQDYTYGQLLGPAMEVKTALEANTYLHSLVDYYAGRLNVGRREAKQIALSNIRYYAGYYDGETTQRVRALFSESGGK